MTAGVDKVTLSGTFTDATGAAATGTVIFTLSAQVVDPVDREIIYDGPMTVTLDANGHLSIFGGVPADKTCGFFRTPMARLGDLGRRAAITPEQARAAYRAHIENGGGQTPVGQAPDLAPPAGGFNTPPPPQPLQDGAE